jgi:hypothetical protein
MSASIRRAARTLALIVLVAGASSCTTPGPEWVNEGDDDPRPEDTGGEHFDALELAQDEHGESAVARIEGAVASTGGGGGRGDAHHAVERHPGLDAPDSVGSGQVFTLRFALTEELTVAGVELADGDFSDDGALVMELGEGDAWDIAVTLSAPGFESLGGGPSRTIRLPRSGDSEQASFPLRAPAVEQAEEHDLLVTLWHADRYLGMVSRPIRVQPKRPEVQGEESVAPPAARSLASPARRAPPPALSLGFSDAPAPDMTITMVRHGDESDYMVIVRSPHLQPTFDSFSLSSDAKERLLRGYRGLSSRASRGGRMAGGSLEPEDKIAYARGVGEEIWTHYAPEPFKRAYWKLRDQLGDDFDSLQVITNDPLLPWELMRPVRDDGSEPRDFLGTELLIARWHLADRGRQLPAPPLVLPVREVVVVAPEYEGVDRLAGQVEELEALRRLPGFRRAGGKMAAFRELVSSPPAGIVHFAGHGRIVESAGGSEFSIQLEDGRSLDLTTWKGLNRPGRGVHPLFFFNACEVGQAENVAGFVDGWAPAVLETGASGYIGTLWPVGDKGASGFAIAFYDELGRELQDSPSASVAGAVRAARRQFFTTGDPTFLAYVYYGDPALELELLGR